MLLGLDGVNALEMQQVTTMGLSHIAGYWDHVPAFVIAQLLCWHHCSKIVSCLSLVLLCTLAATGTADIHSFCRRAIREALDDGPSQDIADNLDTLNLLSVPSQVTHV